jgi:two-component system sensor histidine kinase AtoS
VPDSNAAGYAFLGLTAIVAMLVSVLVFAVLRFSAAAHSTRNVRSDERNAAFLTAALEDAIQKLKTQERATAARAAASEHLSTQIVAGLSSGLLVVSRDGTLRIVNPAARRILALDGASEDGNYQQLLAATPELAGVIHDALETGAPISRRTIALNGQSGPAHLGVTVSPLQSATDSVDAAVCLFTDLSAVMAREEQLQLQEALARVGELSAGLAHEFRNGLATIHGYARLLDPEAMPERFRPYVTGLREETTALGEVVNNFLKFARPDPLSVTRIDLREVVERAVSDFSDEATVHIRGIFGEIEGDDVLLRQAFSNLLRNSVEAAAAAGRRATIVIEGGTDATEQWRTVRITDDGPGISSDASSRLFEPFFTTKAQGTGLGLAIVQKVIVSHNGTISAQNSPPGGGDFRIRLPLRQPLPTQEL